ncbi:hypothetical protein [Roseicitreum antarcticum]|nr:hypothetical protein [Roseicitreum antarcticum]
MYKHPCSVSGPKMGAGALILWSALSAAQAQTPPSTGADERPGTLIAVLSGDWNNDGAPDAAVLQRGGDAFADLLVLSGDPVYGLQSYAHLRDLVFAGMMGGQLPGLVARSDSSFALHSENTGIGRNAWMQDITIAWRQGGFVVAGFTYSTYDRLDVDAGGTCDVNLLTGGYELTLGQLDAKVQRGTGADRAFPLTALRDGYAPAVCAPLIGG